MVSDQPALLSRRAFNRILIGGAASAAAPGVLAVARMLPAPAVAAPQPFFDFTRGRLPSGAGFTRAGVARFWDESGILQRAPAGAPRFDYHPDTGEGLGLLVEEEAVNELGSGRDLLAGGWQALNAIVSYGSSFPAAPAESGAVVQAERAGATVLAMRPLARGEYTFSAWMCRLAGHGRVDITLDGGRSWTEVTGFLLGGDWARVAATATLARPTVGFRLGRVGDAIEVDFCQLERGGFASTEIFRPSKLVSEPASWMMTRSGERLTFAVDGRTWSFRWPEAAALKGERRLSSVRFQARGRDRYDIEIATPDATYTLLAERLA